MNKISAMKKLREEWMGCIKCGLCDERINLVFGDGNPEADILIIGEAPGRLEDDTGLTFRGKAGKILGRYLDTCGLDKQCDCFSTNVIACRPTVEVFDERKKVHYLDNRQPNKEEKLCCRPRLLEIIYIVDPMLIVTIGKVPYQALTGKPTAIAKVRGQVQEFTLEGRNTSITYPIMPMYHTAYLSRSSDHREEGIWGQTGSDWAETCNIVDYLREAYEGIEPPYRIWRDE